MRKTHLAINVLILFTITDKVFSQYTDRFDGTTTSNWQRQNLLDIGSANWAITNGAISFKTLGTANESQVFVKNQIVSLNNTGDWSLEVGMANQTKAQLQVYVANSDFSDYFGVTLGGYFGASNQYWGAEFPGQSWWTITGIRSNASQTGSIKIGYDSQNRTYSLLYSNAGYDPISNNYSWSLLATNSATATGSLNLYIGINAGTVGYDGLLGVQPTNYGQMSVDNLKVVPEPSALSLLALGLGGFFMFRSRRKIVVAMAILFTCFLGREVYATNLYEIVDPNLSHQLVTIQNSSSVPYTYKISLNTTTLNDWLFFLNSKAQTSDPYNLFKSSDFSQTQSNGAYTYSLLDVTAGNHPVRGINLYDAYRYANWVENGANSSADTENGAYDLSNLSQWGLASRSSSAKYFVQSNSEWLWSWQSLNMDSNYFEWTDTPNYFYEGSTLVCNGGIIMQLTYDNNQPHINGYADTPYRAAGFGSGETTFRLGSVPEPSALSLLAVGLGGLEILRRRRS